MITLPALSEDGWVNTPVKQADYLFSHFFLSDYSQTYIYTDKVSSLSWLLQQYGNEPPEMARNLKATLEQYFGRYFDNVVVESTSSQVDNNPNEQNLSIYVTFQSKDGVTYNLGRMVNVENTKIKNVVTLSNYGEEFLKGV